MSSLGDSRAGTDLAADDELAADSDRPLLDGSTGAPTKLPRHYQRHQLTKQDKIRAWREDKELAEFLKQPVLGRKELRAEVDEARTHACALMDERGAYLLESLQIEGRERWIKNGGRYEVASFSSCDEDVRILLSYLPREVEWSYWVVERGSGIDRRLRLLHHLAERDALTHAGRDGERYQRAPVLREDGRLERTEVLVGFEYSLWDAPRYQVVPPVGKRARLDWELGDQTPAQYLKDQAEALGWKAEDFVQPFARGNQTLSEYKRRAELKKIILKLRQRRATLQVVADALNRLAGSEKWTREALSLNSSLN